MRRFLFKLGVFLFIQAAIALLVFRNAAHRPNYGYMAAFEDKHRLLAAHDRPHLILVGGSNVAFGFDSGLLEKEVGMPVINLGLHASLGLEFYLSVAQTYARPGDVIVLVPEWYMLLSPHDSKPEFVEQLMRQSLSAWPFMLPETLSEWKQFCDVTALPESARVIQAGMKLYRSKDFRRAQNEARPQLYTRLNFNEHGDVIGHHDREPPEKIHQIDTARLDFNAALFQDACQTINDWAAHCRSAGAKVYFAYEPIPIPVFERTPEGIANGHQHLKSHLEIPILHPPSSVRFPVDCFFDTVSHLNRAGKSIRTALVAEALQAQDSKFRPLDEFGWRTSDAGFKPGRQRR